MPTTKTTAERANLIFRQRPFHLYFIMTGLLLLFLFWETITGYKLTESLGGWLWFLFVLSGLLIALCVWLIIQFTVSIPRTKVSFHRIAWASVLLIVMIILSYANLYHQFYHLFGYHSFSGEKLSGGDFLYYSVTTFTSTGYGDIYPVSWLCKAFAATEMLIGYVSGTVFMAILVWKLVHEQNRS